VVQAKTANNPTRTEPNLTNLFFGLRTSPWIRDDAAINDMAARNTKTPQGTPRGKPPENTNSITNSNPVETRDTHKDLDNVQVSIWKF
jgi:hypothetical protein